MYTHYNSPPKFYIKFTLDSKTTNLKGKKPEFRFKPEDSHAWMRQFTLKGPWKILILDALWCILRRFLAIYPKTF